MCSATPSRGWCCRSRSSRADDLRQAARDAGQAHAVHVLGPAGPLLGVDDELDAAGAGLDPAAVADRAAAVDTQDVAILVYTSGSTGRPKGALLRHSGLVRLGRVQTAAYRVDQATTIGDGPINHVGMPGDIVAMVAVSGGSLRLHERFDAGATLATPTVTRRTASSPRRSAAPTPSSTCGCCVPTAAGPGPARGARSACAIRR
jgi:acyl-CoA synthetase (AMP-forming)/AMP-acid ligase II